MANIQGIKRLFKNLFRGFFMKTSKRTVVLMTVELNEVDLDIAIDNYPKVESQILDYIRKKEGIVPDDSKDVCISMTVELKVDNLVVNRVIRARAAEVERHMKPDVGYPERPEIDMGTPPRFNEGPLLPPPLNTETKDQLMDPGTMIDNLARDFKPSPDDEED
jgi:hypothetical protein